MVVLIPSKQEPNATQMMQAVEDFLHPDKIVLCNDRYGQGKGWALRQAIKYADSLPVIFIDGDGDILPSEIAKILPYLDQYDVVVGKKELPKRWDRKLLTYFSRIWVWLLFRISSDYGLVDTQTGVKGFNYIPEWKIDGWAFDIEILWDAKLSGKKIIEVPVKATVSQGKSIKDVLSAWIETIKIRMGV